MVEEWVEAILEELKWDVEDLEHDVEEIKERLKRLEERIEGLEKKVRELDDRVGQLENIAVVTMVNAANRRFLGEESEADKNEGEEG